MQPQKSCWRQQHLDLFKTVPQALNILSVLISTNDASILLCFMTLPHCYTFLIHIFKMNFICQKCCIVLREEMRKEWGKISMFKCIGNLVIIIRIMYIKYSTSWYFLISITKGDFHSSLPSWKSPSRNAWKANAKEICLKKCMPLWGHKPRVCKLVTVN